MRVSVPVRGRRDATRSNATLQPVCGVSEGAINGMPAPDRRPADEPDHAARSRSAGLEDHADSREASGSAAGGEVSGEGDRVTQMSLLVDVARVEKPYKRVRQTSRESYRRQRAIDVQKAKAGKETHRGRVLRCLAAYWNARQQSPTASELLAWMVERGECSNDPNHVRPKLNALVELGLVESAGKRTCSVSRQTVYVWRVKQR